MWTWLYGEWIAALVCNVKGSTSLFYGLERNKRRNFNKQEKIKRPQCEWDTKCQYCVEIFLKGVRSCLYNKVLLKHRWSTETVFSILFQTNCSHTNIVDYKRRVWCVWSSPPLWLSTKAFVMPSRLTNFTNRALICPAKFWLRSHAYAWKLPSTNSVWPVYRLAGLILIFSTVSS